MALQTPHISYSKLGKMSKCAENFLKSREQIKTELDREEKLLKEAKFDLDLDKIVSGIGNGKSPCISSKNVQEIYKNCRNIVFEEFQQNKSILIDFSNGRLGNQMSSFASTFALSRQLNLKQIMTHHRHTMLSKYFQLSKEPEILESHFCSPCKDLQFLPVSSAADHLGQVLVMPAYPNMVARYRQYLDTFREVFMFRQEFQEKAQALLAKVKTDSELENPTFVAIHNRRGDYKYAIKSYGGKLVRRKYFELARDIFRKNIKNVVFVVVSDDIEWSKENIFGNDTFYSVDDDSEEAVGIDLSIMANCNHTIITYGTFGMWGAILANGKVIAADNAAKESLDQMKVLKEDKRERWMFLNQEKTVVHYKDDIELLFKE